MIKILLLEYGESIDKGSDDTRAYTVMDIAEADIVGSIDKTGEIVKVIKSRTSEIGKKFSLSEFGSQAAMGMI